MAFTAVHYPTDKDQGHLPYWLNNEELGVASDNFFDQFVIFDGTDPTGQGASELLEDPPSPSILLDSLNDSLANSSSNDQDTPPRQSQTEVEAPSASLKIASIPSSQVPILEQSRSVPPELTTPLLADPVLSGGSISDSELLRLEGISLKSPRLDAASSSSSPQFANTTIASPRKHSRVFDSIRSKFHRVTHRSKSHKLHHPSQMAATGGPAMVNTFRRDEGACYEIPASLDLNGLGDIKLEESSVPLDSRGLPLSPPLTGRIPADHHPSDIIDFVTGQFDDPFCDDLLAPPAVINPVSKSHNASLDTPMHTPGMHEDAFYHHSMAIMESTNGHSFHPQHRQPKHRNTSSAEWPMEGILTSDTNADAIWTASSPSITPAYVPEGGSSMPSPGWWDAPQHNGPHGRPRTHSGIHSTSSLSLPMHGQQGELPYEYTTSHNADLSGLMIHMPQPRAPQAAVLGSGMGDTTLTMSPISYYPTPGTVHRHPSASSSASSSHHHPHRGQHQHHHLSEQQQQRRPRPRAPSSGARHYGGGGGAPMSSPRKIFSCYALREESASPSPMPHGHGHGPHPRPRHRASESSLAVRKRRSWSRRAQHQGGGAEAPRTPSGAHHRPTRSASYSGGGEGGMSRGRGGEGGGGGSFSIEFCNYTPNDKKVLMNGVAPSGSSKTKARREREAMEHKRKLNDLYIDALRAAGGDVDKLLEAERAFRIHDEE
ncbi:hypothetical protein GGR54DRAFT_629158 [Hypoxylon sp. NC1633]|nr:hypothetical protein GGR54DRAFT_629158 [Hypoxylon sp. NC1633]